MNNLFLFLSISILTYPFSINDGMVGDERKECNCQNCNVELIEYVRLNLDSLDEQKVESFLGCFNKICFSNVEFAEAANYSLFILLQRLPDLVLKIISQNKNINLEFIKFTLENPVSDDIDLNSTYNKIEKVKGYEKIKDTLLNSIETAKGKFK